MSPAANPDVYPPPPYHACHLPSHSLTKQELLQELYCSDRKLEVLRLLRASPDLCIPVPCASLGVDLRPPTPRTPQPSSGSPARPMHRFSSDSPTPRAASSPHGVGSRALAKVVGTQPSGQVLLQCGAVSESGALSMHYTALLAYAHRDTLSELRDRLQERLQGMQSELQGVWRGGSREEPPPSWNAVPPPDAVSNPSSDKMKKSAKPLVGLHQRSAHQSVDLRCSAAGREVTAGSGPPFPPEEAMPAPWARPPHPSLASHIAAAQVLEGQPLSESGAAILRERRRGPPGIPALLPPAFGGDVQDLAPRTGRHCRSRTTSPDTLPTPEERAEAEARQDREGPSCGTSRGSSGAAEAASQGSSAGWRTGGRPAFSNTPVALGPLYGSEEEERARRREGEVDGQEEGKEESMASLEHTLASMELSPPCKGWRSLEQVRSMQAGGRQIEHWSPFPSLTAMLLQSPKKLPTKAVAAPGSNRRASKSSLSPLRRRLAAVKLDLGSPCREVLDGVQGSDRRPPVLRLFPPRVPPELADLSCESRRQEDACGGFQKIFVPPWGMGVDGAVSSLSIVSSAAPTSITTASPAIEPEPHAGGRLARCMRLISDSVPYLVEAMADMDLSVDCALFDKTQRCLSSLLEAKDELQHALDLAREDVKA